jgi:hypothetical protein
VKRHGGHLEAEADEQQPSAMSCIGVGDIACAAIRLPMRSRRVLPVTP